MRERYQQLMSLLTLIAMVVSCKPAKGNDYRTTVPISPINLYPTQPVSPEFVEHLVTPNPDLHLKPITNVSSSPQDPRAEMMLFTTEIKYRVSLAAYAQTQGYIESQVNIDDYPVDWPKSDSILETFLSAGFSEKEADILKQITLQPFLNAGYSLSEANIVKANLPAYIQAEKLTGIPAALFIALHGVESNYSIQICSWSDYCRLGPLQVTIIPENEQFTKGEILDYNRFLGHLVNHAGPVILEKARASGISDIKTASFEDLMEIAARYNGMPSVRIGPDGRTCYGDDWRNHPYVMSGAPGAGSDWFALDWEGDWFNLGNYEGVWSRFDKAQQVLEDIGLAF